MANTFPTKTASYRFRAAGGTGVGREIWRESELEFIVVLDERVAVLLGIDGRILDILVRDVAALRIDERSEAIVDANELRLEGGGWCARGGGGGGGSFDRIGGET